MELSTVSGSVRLSFSRENGLVYVSVDISPDRRLLRFCLIQVIIGVCSFFEFSNDTVSTFTQHRKVRVNRSHTEAEHTMDQTWDVSLIIREFSSLFTIKQSVVCDNGAIIFDVFYYQNF